MFDTSSALVYYTSKERISPIWAFLAQGVQL
jgi:hypothetical protein